MIDAIFDPVARAYFKNKYGGSSGGEADHSMEDALLSGTVEHYVNDRVTKINDRQYISIWATPFWWSQDVLKSVSMAKLESMPRDIFLGFAALESVDLPSLKSVGPYAFDGCLSLKNVNLPAVTTVGRSAFSGCESLTQLVLPNVTEVQDEAFRLENWDSPVVIDLPKATSFGERPFPIYTNAHILLRNQSVAVANSVLDDGEFEGYIYVPRSLADSYKSAQYWSDLASRVRALEDYTVDGTATGELDTSKI